MRRARALAQDSAEIQETRQRMGAAPGQPIQYHVVVEIPDYPMFRLWLQWATLRPTGPRVIMTSREQWLHRPDELRATMTRLLQDGRPAPIFKGIWSKLPEEPTHGGA